MRNLFAHKGVRDDSGHMSVVFQHGICGHIHESDVPAAVDEPVISPHQLAADFPRRFRVF
jgi:hypothetical protein